MIDAWPPQDLGATFLTSFTFNAPYFEGAILRVLLARGAHPIAVFVDRTAGYEPSLAMLPMLSGAGTDYSLIPVDRSPFAFHPKVHYFAGARAAVVGSGNLTPTGFGGNLEAFDRLSAGEDGAAVGQVREFFVELLDIEGCQVGPDARQHLEKALLEARRPRAVGDTVFLHSLRAGLKDQLRQELLDEPAERMLMAAPFHDPDHKTARSLAGLCRHREPRVAADLDQAPSAMSAFETGVLDDRRPLHAKILSLESRELSVNVVGSANLTRAAWEPGKNVEAIVVRQVLAAGHFDRWLEAAKFRPQDWPLEGARRPPDLSEPATAAVPARWASVAGGRLQLAAPELSDAEFVLESGSRRQAADLAYLGDDLWEGSTPFLPTQSAVVQLRAAGYRPASVLVEQPELLSSSGMARRLQGLIRRAEAGVIEPEERRELLATLGEIFIALCRVSPQPSAKKSATSGASRSTQESQRTGPIEEVESLLAVFGVSSKQRLDHLLAIVRSIAKPPAAETGSGTHPATRPGEHHPEPKLRGNQARVLAAHRRESSLAAEEDRALLTAAIELAMQIGDQLAEVARESAENAALIHHGMVRLLIDLADQLASGRASALRQLRAHLETAWGVADWPAREDGWMLRSDPDHARPELALEALLRCAAVLEIDAPDPGEDEAVALDALHRSLRGIERYASAGGEALKTRSDRERAVLEAIRRRAPRGERARAALEPLWRLEGADIEIARLESADAVEASSEARRARLERRLATLKDQRQRLEEAASAAQLGGDSALELFESARPVAYAGGYRRLLPMPSDGICPACHVVLSAVDQGRIEDPLHAFQCKHCGVLLAHGDLADDVGS